MVSCPMRKVLQDESICQGLGLTGVRELGHCGPRSAVEVEDT